MAAQSHQKPTHILEAQQQTTKIYGRIFVFLFLEMKLSLEPIFILWNSMDGFLTGAALMMGIILFVHVIGNQTTRMEKFGS